MITKRIMYSYHTSFNPSNWDQYKPLELNLLLSMENLNHHLNLSDTILAKKIIIGLLEVQRYKKIQGNVTTVTFSI